MSITSQRSGIRTSVDHLAEFEFIACLSGSIRNAQACRHLSEPNVLEINGGDFGVGRHASVALV